jgi:hypothetical protein
MFPLIFNDSQIMLEAPRDMERDMEVDAKYDSKLWDMLDAIDKHWAREAAGLEPPTVLEPPPDDYYMEPMPQHGMRTCRCAEKLCGLLEWSLNDEWRQLGEHILATIFCDGRPAHRPSSSHIAKRNERIVEQIEYWKARKRQILPDIGNRYRLSAKAVKKIWDARERKAT